MACDSTPTSEYTMAATLPSWNLTGIVTETRELVTQKDNKVWAYAIKVASIGGTYELQTKDADLYRSVGEGQHIEASGVFEEFAGKLRLAVKRVGELKAAELSSRAGKAS